ncbi:MAG: hypothetical protein O3B43_05795 [Chloroflexi bacterium]|nr:hypothetical protein [Chloroflexota bacterium]
MVRTNTWNQNVALQIPAAIVTIAGMVLFPLATHVLPSIGGVPLGARLLPMFYAPLVAAYYFHPAVSVVAALVAPWLNHQLTGAPAEPMVVVLTIELVVFSLAVQALHRRFPRFWIAAPGAYLLAKGVSLIVLTVPPYALVPATAWHNTATSLMMAWPGLVVLFSINWLVMKVSRHGP